MGDSLTRLLRAILPKATAAELAEAAERLGSFVESRAAWVGDTAEGAVRRVEDAVLGRGNAPVPPGEPEHDLTDRVWTQVMGAIAPRLHDIEARARAARDNPDVAPLATELAGDTEWLVGELHAAWAREVALRTRRPSGELERPTGESGR